MIPPTLYGKIIDLRPLTLTDCNEKYEKWLNDPDVAIFLEARWHEQNIITIKNFVQSIINSPDNYFFAIVDKAAQTHIGNIKLGSIHPQYRHADLGYFIGEKSYWGKGIASEAIQLVIDFAFNQLKLHRIEAGTRANNIGSQKALLKNGFKQEAIFRKRTFVKGPDDWCDDFFFSILNSDRQ